MPDIKFNFDTANSHDNSENLKKRVVHYIYSFIHERKKLTAIEGFFVAEDIKNIKARMGVGGFLVQPAKLSKYGLKLYTRGAKVLVIRGIHCSKSKTPLKLIKILKSLDIGIEIK